MTTILMLDDGLHEAKWNERHYPRPEAKAAVESGCLSDGAVRRDWRSKTVTETEIVFASSVPADAPLYHKNYLNYLSRTFGHHNSIVLAPQHFWYTLLCEIAQAVIRQPNEHRKLFTKDPAGKINIIVPCASETEPLRMDALYDEMLGLIPVDTTLFLPSFSTETAMSRLAALAAFLETCSPYYNYMMLACGHPRIKLAGTAQDWDCVASSLDRLRSEFAACSGSPLGDWIARRALPAAVKIRAALDGANEDWFRDIFSEKRCGSGGQTVVDGWFSRLFLEQPRGMREVANFATHVTKVPYTTLPSGTEWNMCFGLFHSERDSDGFMVPDFSWVQVQKLAEPRVTAMVCG